MTNCTDGHECKYQLRQTFTHRRFVCSGCPNIISIVDAEEILNEHAQLKEENRKIEEYANEGWAWVDEFCKLAKTDVFGLRTLLTQEPA